MANKFAWASIGENGHATGGEKGDQTGREVKVGDYYDFGQNCVVRFKNTAAGRRCAKIARFLANDNHTGYNKNDRGSLYNACKKLDWNFSKIKNAIKKGTFPKCNCDCSSFAATCINITYSQTMVGCFTTATMIEHTVKSFPKLFEKISVDSAKKKWKKGDMPLKAGKHVIINV